MNAGTKCTFYPHNTRTQLSLLSSLYFFCVFVCCRRAIVVRNWYCQLSIYTQILFRGKTKYAKWSFVFGICHSLLFCWIYVCVDALHFYYTPFFYVLTHSPVLCGHSARFIDTHTDMSHPFGIRYLRPIVSLWIQFIVATKCSQAMKDDELDVFDSRKIGIPIRVCRRRSEKEIN